MLANFFEIFTHLFMIKAFVAGGFIAVATSLLGVILVLKRYSMIGDGLSHVGFSAYSIALAFNLVPVFFSLPVVAFSALLLTWLSENSKIKGDAAIALISTSFLAIGVVFVSLTTGVNSNVLSYMFGSVLSIGNFDFVLSIIFSIFVILIFLLFYNKFFAVTFDEFFARAVGLKTRLYSFLVAMLVSAMIVVGIKIVGALLISSLILFPVLSSMRVFKTFKWVVINSSLVSLFCVFFGLVFSYSFSLPTGATIVLVNLVVFLIYCFLGFVKTIN